MIPVLPLERKGKRRHSAVSLGTEEKIALRGGGEWSESEERVAAAFSSESTERER